MEKKAETPFDRFKRLAKAVVSVPKKEVDRKQAQYLAKRKKRKAGAEG